jgi:hypothetical protein
MMLDIDRLAPSSKGVFHDSRCFANNFVLGLIRTNRELNRDRVSKGKRIRRYEKRETRYPLRVVWSTRQPGIKEPEVVL